MKAEMKKTASIRQNLQKVFGEIPVKDADHELFITGLAVDADGAISGDPENCVFARACRRMFDSSKVIILRCFAYISLPNADGNREIKRFQIPEKMKRLIIEFDQTGKIPESGFVLVPPTPSRSLDGSAAESRRKNDRDRLKQSAKRKDRKLRRKARLQGSILPEHAIQLPVSMERFGRGMIQFRRSVNQ